MIKSGRREKKASFNNEKTRVMVEDLRRVLVYSVLERRFRGATRKKFELPTGTKRRAPHLCKDEGSFVSPFMSGNQDAGQSRQDGSARKMTDLDIECSWNLTSQDWDKGYDDRADKSHEEPMNGTLQCHGVLHVSKRAMGR